MTDPNTPATPAGWYPDGHGQDRYYDGTAWTEQVRPLSTATESVPVADPNAATIVPKQKMSAKKKWIIGGSIAAGLIVFSSIANAVNGPDDEPVAKPATSVSDTETKPKPVKEEEPEPVILTMPTITGMTVTQARGVLSGMGVEMPATDAGDDWKVLTQTPEPGATGTAEELAALITVTGEAPPPPLTLAQQNVINQAKDYLDYSGFSRTGLIDQLEYEGYSTEDATFGADNAGADWGAEAAESAADYLDYSSFSRQGLYDQLAYEGFTDAEINHGLAAVGY